jgi:conjugative transfer signal peptidase TraF
MTRFSYVMSAYFASMAMIITIFVHPAPRLIWNASDSIPRGLYAAGPALLRLQPGDLVAVAPPPALAAFLATRHYLPLGLPLLKPVAALGGQRVCRAGVAITIDGRHAGDALERDSHRRPLPRWQGCRVLASNEVFVMNRAVPDSFDGRYFGPLPRSLVRARLRPLWVRERHEPVRSAAAGVR